MAARETNSFPTPVAGSPRSFLSLAISQGWGTGENGRRVQHGSAVMLARDPCSKTPQPRGGVAATVEGLDAHEGQAFASLCLDYFPDFSSSIMRRATVHDSHGNRAAEDGPAARSRNGGGVLAAGAGVGDEPAHVDQNRADHPRGHEGPSPKS